MQCCVLESKAGAFSKPLLSVVESELGIVSSGKCLVARRPGSSVDLQKCSGISVALQQDPCVFNAGMR